MKPGSPKRICAYAFAVVSLGLAASPVAAADDFPNKPIRIIVPAAVGGGLDLASRLVAQKMSEHLRQQVIVDNRPGGETMIGTRIAKDMAADGYTILGQANGFTLLPYVKKDPGFEPLKDFTGLGMLQTAPMVMIVAPGSVDRTVQDLVARAGRTKLSYGTGGTATPQQVATAMFLQAAGMRGHAEVPYKGSGPTLPDVASGILDFAFDGFTGSRPFIESGKVRPLATTGSARMAPLPNAPTFLESGYDFSYRLWNGLVVRRGTPEVAIKRLSEALRYAQTHKDFVERFRAEGADPSFFTPEEMTEYLSKEYAANAKLAVDLSYEKQ